MTGKTKMMMLQLWAIAYLPELNYRRDYDDVAGTSNPKGYDVEDNDTKTLINAMADRGGFDNLQFHAIAGPITEERQKLWHDYLMTRWEGLKAADKETHSKDTQANLVAFEEIFLKDAKKGKFHEAEALGCSGNRRARCLETAYARWIRDGRPKDKPISLEISVAYHEFKDDGERFMAQLNENATKTEGFKRTTDREDMDGIRKNLAVGRISYNSLRDSLGVGTAQKYSYLLQCDFRFRDLKLFDRLWLPQDNKGSIWLSKLPQGEGIEPVVRSDPDESVLKDYKAKSSNKNNEEKQNWTHWGPADVLEYYTVTLKEGKKNAAKSMTRDQVKAIGDANGNPFVKAFAKAFAGNDATILEKLLPMEDASKAIAVLVDKAEYKSVDEFLTAFAAAPDTVRAKHVDEVFKLTQAIVKATVAAAKAEEKAESKTEKVKS